MNPIDHLNQLPDSEARTAFERCCGSPRWVNEMLAQRPFRSVEALKTKATMTWWNLEPADWHEAFSHHPQIGADIEHLRQKFSSTAHLAENEQSGVQAASDETLQALAEGNQTYLDKFGYIFVVFATGKSADEMLQLLTERLENPPGIEMNIAAEQQQQITELRLEHLLNSFEREARPKRRSRH